ncbi:hypothetical protein [Pseudomonas lini]
MKKYGKDANTKKIGEWNVNPLFTEGAGCTQSCTDGDMLCCSRAALQGFIYTLKDPELAAYIPELVKNGEAALPNAGSDEAL